MSGETALRPLREDDAPEVLAAFSSDPDMHRQGTVRDLAEAQAYTNRLIARESTTCAIAVTRAGDSLIGLMGIDVDRSNRNGWFWYWMNASHRGRGITSRAAIAVANWALSDGGLQRLELGHRVNNPASARVAISSGFIQEGVERGKFLIDGQRVDVHTYGRLVTDPWPAPASSPVLTDALTSLACSGWRSE